MVTCQDTSVNGRHLSTNCARRRGESIISISQLVQCSFGIKMYLKQKCFDGSCTQSCSVHPYNSDTCAEPRFKSFSNRITDISYQISNQIKIFWTESLDLKSNCQMCSNHGLNPNRCASLAVSALSSLRCFNTIGWVSGRASDLQKQVTLVYS